MLIVEQYFRTGLLVYLWSKYLWQQILQKRQRNVLNICKIAPAEIRQVVKEEEYENRRRAELQRSGFEIFKSTLDIGLATTFILFRGFQKIWEKSSEIVAYFNIQDNEEIIKNALFLTIVTSGTFIAALPFTMLEMSSIQTSYGLEKRFTTTAIFLDHCVAQTLLFPFVCLFVVAFKFGGDSTMLWIFAFAEFQLLNEFLLDVQPSKPLENDDLRNEIVQLAKKYHFPLENVLITKRPYADDKNVCLRGFPKARNIVLRWELVVADSTNETNRLTTGEINALIANELSHWRRNHSFINFIVDQTHLCLRLYTMHRFLNNENLYRAFGFENRPLAVGLTLLQYCPLFDLYNFVARIINRKLVLAADKDVKRTIGDATLKSAIIKINDNAKLFPIQDSLYSLCWNHEATCYERIEALNEYAQS